MLIKKFHSSLFPHVVTIPPWITFRLQIAIMDVNISTVPGIIIIIMFMVDLLHKDF
jgi:hypothetical protein